MYNFIVNPETGRRVNVNGKIGKKVLNNYLNQLGGAIRAGSRIPSEQFLQAGGHDGPCGVNPSSGRCAKSASWDRVNCQLRNKRCVKNKSPKKAAKKMVKKMVKKGKTVHPKKLKAVRARVTKPRKSPAKKEEYKVVCDGNKCRRVKVTKPKKAAKKPRKGRSEKWTGRNNRKSMRASRDVKSHGKTVKTVTTKKHGKSQRLSAGEYYRNYGLDNALGDRCNIRRDGEYKCLLKTKSGVARWAKKSKSGKGQEACGDWSSQCQEPDFA